MDEAQLHHWLAWGELAFAVGIAVLLSFIDAPYGRHDRPGWGPSLPARLGWILMESPAVVVFVGVYALGEDRARLVPLLLLALWQAHYVHRAFVFPFQARNRGKSMPIFIALLALAFNSLNAYLNARWISHFGDYPLAWLWDPRFGLGVAVFAAGAWINRDADRRLLALRAPGESSGYRIPYGGLYGWVSCPNYLGEIVMWLGFALASWSLAALAFAVATAANLGPRAVAHHRWYRERFDDYPEERRALVPYLL